MDERSEERRRMVEQFVSRGLRDEAVLAAMRTRAAGGLHRRRARRVRLRGCAAADRGRADDLAAVHRRGDDRGARARAARPGSRGRHGLGLRGRGAEPHRDGGVYDRAPRGARAGGGAAAAGARLCQRARAPWRTARWAGRSTRHTTRSSSPPAARRSPSLCSSNSPSAAGS